MARIGQIPPPAYLGCLAAGCNARQGRSQGLRSQHEGFQRARVSRRRRDTPAFVQQFAGHLKRRHQQQPRLAQCTQRIDQIRGFRIEILPGRAQRRLFPVSAGQFVGTSADRQGNVSHARRLRLSTGQGPQPWRALRFQAARGASANRPACLLPLHRLPGPAPAGPTGPPRRSVCSPLPVRGLKAIDKSDSWHWSMRCAAQALIYVACFAREAAHDAVQPTRPLGRSFPR